MTRSFYSLALCASKGRYLSATRFFRTSAEAERYSDTIIKSFVNEPHYKLIAPPAKPTHNELFGGMTLVATNALTSCNEVWELIIYGGRLPCACLCLENAVGSRRNESIENSALLFGLLRNGITDVLRTDNGRLLVGRPCHVYLYLLITSDKRLQQLIEAEGHGLPNVPHIAEAIRLLESVPLTPGAHAAPGEIVSLRAEDAMTFCAECDRVVFTSGLAGKLSSSLAAIA